jgi:hypothetical protein
MEGIKPGGIMLPDPNVFKDFADDAIHAAKCGWLRWRITRLERKNEKLRMKEMNLRIKGWAR